MAGNGQGSALLGVCVNGIETSRTAPGGEPRRGRCVGGLTVSGLNDAHHGRTATLTLPDGTTRTGRLAHQRRPGAGRHGSACLSWWLFCQWPTGRWREVALLLDPLGYQPITIHEPGDAA